MSKVANHYRGQSAQAATYTLTPTVTTPPPVTPTETPHWIWLFVIFLSGGFSATLFWTVLLVANLR